ncbi:hypothetical protein [Paenibacillus sp. UNC496MF]|uniref:hypothetical protein n=1 Tax=Paenibacillus sp. UNC496MF TaxID=1502753 RepID=UPI000B889D67|nr:hypothetical protein [Paenibacillus sp. UNC496MF]
MFRKSNFATLLVAVSIFTVTSLGIVNAQSENETLEEKTGVPINKFVKNPVEAANQIATNYFEAIKQEKDKNGAALTKFEIVNTDVSNPEDIIVSVNTSYEDGLSNLPSVDYHIMKNGDSYQIKKQICVFDMDINSPTYRTVKVCKFGEIGDALSITL